MKRILTALLLLLVFAVSATAMIRGHKWGESPEQTKAIEAKLGSEQIPAQVENGQIPLIFEGKIGLFEVRILFFYYEDKLIQIFLLPRTDGPDQESILNKLVEVLKHKYSLNISNKISKTMVPYGRFWLPLEKNINLDQINRMATIGYDGFLTHINWHLSKIHGTYFGYSAQIGSNGAGVYYMSQTLFDAFHKQLEDYAAKETARLKAQRRVEDDM